MMIRVAMTKLLDADVRQKLYILTFHECPREYIQLKSASITPPTLIAQLIIRQMIQMVEMIARRTR